MSTKRGAKPKPVAFDLFRAALRPAKGRRRRVAIRVDRPLPEFDTVELIFDGGETLRYEVSPGRPLRRSGYTKQRTTFRIAVDATRSKGRER